MIARSGTDVVGHRRAGRGPLPFWRGLALGCALLLLGLALMSLLAQAQSERPSPAAPGYADGQQAGRPLASAAPVPLRASASFTEPVTPTALLPLVANSYTQPPPKPWTGEVVATYANCTLTRLFGFVRNQYDELEGDVWIHYWADGWDGAWARSSWEQMGDRNWDGTLDNRPREVTWYACVVPERKSWDCQSNVVEAPTSANCETGIQVYQIDFRRN